MEEISTDIATTKPAAMPAALQNRLLAAMQQAVDEEQDCREVEQMLRHLAPAPMPARLVGQLGVQMYVAAQQQKKPYARSSWKRGGVAAAAALVLCVTGGALLVPGRAEADSDTQGLVSRNIIDAQRTGRVDWRHGQPPVRHYEVIYEDAFVLDADDTTTVIRVPNKTEVEVEEEYL